MESDHQTGLSRPAETIVAGSVCAARRAGGWSHKRGGEPPRLTWRTGHQAADDGRNMSTIRSSHLRRSPLLEQSNVRETKVIKFIMLPNISAASYSIFFQTTKEFATQRLLQTNNKIPTSLKFIRFHKNTHRIPVGAGERRKMY